MAWTQTDIDKLKAAIALGALRVSYGERDVTYRSLAEMRETLGMIEAEVNAAAGMRPAKQIRFQTGKGLC
jgi:collagenase-like PrtC family protease